MADPKSYIGAIFQAVVGVPSTVDASGFAALTYSTTIGKVVDESPSGDSHADITWTGLSTGRVTHITGAVDGGEITLTFKYDPGGDAGQQFLWAQNGSGNNVSFKVTDPDAKVEYLYAIVVNMKGLPRDAATAKGFTVTLRVNSPTIRPSF